MRLSKLTLHRFPGFKRPFSLEKLHPGLNIIVGPNASGKTSICHAVRRLLWPQINKRWPVMAIHSEWVSDRGSFTMEVNEACSKVKPVLIEPDNALHAGALPDEAFLPCFSMTIDELFDEKDHSFVQKMAQEIAGGYDLDQAQERCMPLVNWRTLFRDWKDMGQRVASYQQMQEMVREESRLLPELEAGIQAAQQAQQELVRLEKQIRWKQERNKRESQKLCLQSFPEPLRASRIQPTDWKDYEQWQLKKKELEQQREALCAKKKDLTERLGLWEAPSFSKEEWEGQWERIGRLQRLELEKRELQKKIEKLRATLQIQQQFLGMTEEEELNALCVEVLDPLASLWHDLDRVDAELGGIEEQIRLCDVPLSMEDGGGRGEFQHFSKVSSEKLSRWIQGVCALALYPQRIHWYEGACVALSLFLIGYGGWALDPVHYKWWAVLAGSQVFLSVPWVYRYLRRRSLCRHYDMKKGGTFPLMGHFRSETIAQALEAMIQYKSYWLGVERSLHRKNDLEAHWKQKTEERREITERLHEVAQQAHLHHLCRTYVELIDHLKALHRDWVCFNELKWEETHLMEEWDREWGVWQYFIRAWGETPEKGGDYLGVYTRIKKRLADAETLQATVTMQVDCEKELADCTEKINQLLRRTKCLGHPEKLQFLVDLWPEYQREKEKLKNLEQQLDELGGEAAFDSAISLEWLEEEKIKKEVQVNHLGDLSERKGKVIARIQQMEQASEGEALLREYEEKGKRVREVSIDFVKKQLTSLLIDEARREFQQESQPWVLEKAVEWFHRFTKYQFQLELPKSSISPISYQVLETATGERKGFDQLSRGTRMQLLMAVRLAFAFHSETGGESLPLFLDEILANTDAERFEAVAQVIAELLSSGRQIFYLTCNGEDVIKWKRICPEAHVIDLAKIHSDQAYFAASALPIENTMKIPQPLTDQLDEYVQALKLPRWRLDEPLQMVSVHYLVDNVRDLYRLLSSGIAHYGNLQSQKKELMEQAFPHSFSSMLRRGNLLEQFFALKTQGRGKPLSKEALIQGKVSSHFTEALWEIAQEVGRDAQQLVAILEDKRYKDGRKKGFRSESKKELKAFLLQEGYIDPRPVLTDEAVRCALLPLTEEEEDRLFLEILYTGEL